MSPTTTIWLKVLGRSQPDDQRVRDDWRNELVGDRTISVTFPPRGRPSVRPGDLMVLHAAGHGVVFATGTVRNLPHASGDADWPWKVDVDLDLGVEWLHDGVPLARLDDGHRPLNKSIQQKSHIKLEQAEYENAVALLPPL